METKQSHGQGNRRFSVSSCQPQPSPPWLAGVARGDLPPSSFWSPADRRPLTATLRQTKPRAKKSSVLSRRSSATRMVRLSGPSATRPHPTLARSREAKPAIPSPRSPRRSPLLVCPRQTNPTCLRTDYLARTYMPLYRGSVPSNLQSHQRSARPILDSAFLRNPELIEGQSPSLVKGPALDLVQGPAPNEPNSRPGKRES
jgi:hypothetical protein